MGYRLRFTPYAGGGYDCTAGDRAYVRHEAAAVLRHGHAQGDIVSILTRGSRWGFETPDDAAMVSDQDGFLSIVHDVFTCRECGSEHEGIGDAMGCCTS